MEESEAIQPVNSADQQKTPETHEHSSDQARGFFAAVSIACTNELQKNWYGVVVHYEDLKQNKQKADQAVKKIVTGTKAAFASAMLAVTLLTAPAVEASDENTPHQINSSAHPEDDWYALSSEIKRLSEQNSKKKIPDETIRSEEPPETTQNSSSRLDLLKTHESFIKYGPYALSAPSLVNEDVVEATVRLYRKGDSKSEEIAHWINHYADKYNLNTETVMTAFILQEGSFGEVTGTKSGNNNFGNIRNMKTGEFRDYETIAQGIEAVFWQVDRYVRVWPIEKGREDIQNLDAALHVYAPPFDNNPTEERIEVGKLLIDGLREISDKYEKGEISENELEEKIHDLRATLQKETGSEYV